MQRGGAKSRGTPGQHNEYPVNQPSSQKHDEGNGGPNSQAERMKRQTHPPFSLHRLPDWVPSPPLSWSTAPHHPRNARNPLGGRRRANQTIGFLTHPPLPDIGPRGERGEKRRINNSLINPSFFLSLSFCSSEKALTLQDKLPIQHNTKQDSAESTSRKQNVRKRLYLLRLQVRWLLHPRQINVLSRCLSLYLLVSLFPAIF